MNFKEKLTDFSEKPLKVSEDLFVSLFKADRKRLYAYIYAYVANKSAADDIFQETSTLLWKKFQDFKPGTDFSKWANSFAYYQVKSYRHKENKHLNNLSDEVVEALAESAESVDVESKWQLLKECRSNLPDHTKELYEDFYIKNKKAQEVADHTGRSIFAIRKAILKLRKKLFDCVDFKRKECDS